MADRVAAIVLAAGRGARLGGNIPKQFLKLGGIPLLVHSLQIFQFTQVVTEVILVVPEDDCDHCRKTILPSFGIDKVTQVVAGGARRQDSVCNGIKAVAPGVDVIVVHDAARPFVTTEMVNQAVEMAQFHGASVVAVPMRDTVKRVREGGLVDSTLDRSELWLAQTPQAFQTALLVEAHRQGEQEDIEATDDAVLIEQMGYEVVVVNGSYNNIKITRPEDLILGEAMLAAKANQNP